MTAEEKKCFLFAQTCVLLASRVAPEGAKPTEVITYRFEETYKALLAEFDKPYVKSTK
ncbi:hypothetical protein JBO49_04475 [Serratia fonticola]|uniref:hypothetical protein n=1 Tax=Serratia fonticola TaxID=47917 RepID=UPI00192AA13F|nr:hypothetical protein [Serratia fonticola]MBL5859870.1 hypothetical protein [Serratia fonticola]